jgi:hypothetical protein
MERENHEKMLRRTDMACTIEESACWTNFRTVQQNTRPAVHSCMTNMLSSCVYRLIYTIHVLHTIYSSLTFTKDINQHAEIAVHNCHFSSQLEMMHNTLQTDGDVSTLPPTPNMKAYIHAIAFTFILCMHLAYCAHNIFVQIQHLPFHSPKW